MWNNNNTCYDIQGRGDVKTCSTGKTTRYLLPLTIKSVCCICQTWCPGEQIIEKQWTKFPTMRLTAKYTSGVFAIIKFFLCCCFLNLRLAFGTFLLGSKMTGCTEGWAHVWAINPVVPWRMATLPAQNPQPQGTLGDSGITWDLQLWPIGFRFGGRKGRRCSTLISHRKVRNRRSRQTWPSYLEFCMVLN